MTTRDAAFLEEVKGFLVSFDVPTFPTPHTLADDENSDEASPTDAVSTEKEAPKSMDSRTSSRGKRKKLRQVLDAAAKHELEKAKDRNRRSAYRERRKNEKDTLQQQVGELTTELTGLQKAKEAERSLASAAWEVVAKRQLQARVDAEEKQRRLIRAVESRAAMIQEFQGFMNDHRTNVDDVDDVATYKHKRIRLEPSDAELYQAYTNELDESFAQTDEALKAYGLDSTAGWDKPRRQWKEDGKTGYYVYLDKHVMLFDFQHICRYTWQAAQLQHRQDDRENFDGIEDPENTSGFKFRVTTRLNSGRTASVLQRVVVRRYVVEDQSVVVWRTFTEGEGMFTGMHADESGWCISIPLPSSRESSTLVRTMVRHVPMHFSTKSTQEPDTKQFTGFVLETGSEDATEITTRLEKLLLQDDHRC